MFHMSSSVLRREYISSYFSMLVVLVVLIFPKTGDAGTLSFVSDLITDPAPSATTSLHTIGFTIVNPVPAGGRLVIAPEGSGGSSFVIPFGLDWNDVQLRVSSGGGPFTSRTLAAAQSATEDGVTVLAGAGGTISFTLASGVQGLLTNDRVQVVIGNANFITSPPVQNSYRIRIRTADAVLTPLDVGTAMIALTQPVGVGGQVNVVKPFRYNGLPSGLLPGATTLVLVSLNTDIPATCKYATSSGFNFYAMSSSTIFLDANGGLLHYIEVPVAENNIFSYYLRCINPSGYPNDDDYLITFEIGVKPNASSTPLPPPPPPTPSGPSGGGGGGGGGGVFLKSGNVIISGSGIPGGSMTITQDGKVVKEEPISILGTFSDTFTNLERGTYTWGVYVKDPDGIRSSTYNSTIYLIGNTNNLIAPVYLSPTIKAVKTTVGVGEDLNIMGYGIALKQVLAIMNKQGDVLSSKIVTGTTTANGNGSWKMKLSTAGLARGTYEVKVQSIISKGEQSNFSPVLYIGVGENPNPDFKNRADLNHDGKVNLVDFSILLFNWKGSDATADINQDGTVNLTDFSIMLANWTG